jgi:hypothetical protein
VYLVLVVHPANSHESSKAEVMTLLHYVLHQLEAAIAGNTMFI